MREGWRRCRTCGRRWQQRNPGWRNHPVIRRRVHFVFALRRIADTDQRIDGFAARSPRWPRSRNGGLHARCTAIPRDRRRLVLFVSNMAGENRESGAEGEDSQREHGGAGHGSDWFGRDYVSGLTAVCQLFVKAPAEDFSADRDHHRQARHDQSGSPPVSPRTPDHRRNLRCGQVRSSNRIWWRTGTGGPRGASSALPGETLQESYGSPSPPAPVPDFRPEAPDRCSLLPLLPPHRPTRCSALCCWSHASGSSPSAHKRREKQPMRSAFRPLKILPARAGEECRESLCSLVETSAGP